MAHPLAIFALWRLVDLSISYIATQFVPYLGFFPYKEILTEYGLPDFLASFANFDGAQYLTLVREGYNTYTQAYFPLYFLVVRIISYLLPTPNAPRPHNDLLAALLVSNVFFLAGLHYFKNYLMLLLEKRGKAAAWGLVFLLVFPTSFFFGAVYTEGLFFFLCIGSLYHLHKKQYAPAALLAMLSSSARLMGIFLVIPFLFHLLSLREREKFHFERKYLLVIFPFLGAGIYSIYLWASTGDPLFFFNAQPAFGANRSTSLVLLPQVYFRYAKIFLTAAPNFQYFVSLVECVFFTGVFGVLILDLKSILSKKAVDYERIGLSLFSFINLLLPTLTGTFSSIPRYGLFSISFFLYLAALHSRPLKWSLAIVFGLLHILLLSLFIQGYFIS